MPNSIPARLKAVRETLGCTQKEMAKAVGIKYRSWQDYESGKSVPGGNALIAVARLGININWILTGRGSFRISEANSGESGGLLTTVARAVAEVMAEQKEEFSEREHAAVTQSFARLYEKLSARPDPAILGILTHREPGES